MATTTAVVRADVVGSLLRPEYLREAREAARAGTMTAGELRAIFDQIIAAFPDEPVPLDRLAVEEGRRAGKARALASWPGD